VSDTGHQHVFLSIVGVIKLAQMEEKKGVNKSLSGT
jgi:hypothetical protein